MGMLGLAKNSLTLRAAWHGALWCRRPFVRPFLTNCILKALQNGYVGSLIHGLVLGKKLLMHQTIRVKESDQLCLDI
jgi:hypothetical protein